MGTFDDFFVHLRLIFLGMLRLHYTIQVTTISSFGIAGVDGGATFAALMVLSAMNLPVALVGFLISVEPLIDMGRTALNVSDSMVAGAVSGRILGENDMTVYNSKDAELDQVQAC